MTREELKTVIKECVNEILNESIDLDLYKNYSEISDAENKIADLIHKKVYLESQSDIKNIDSLKPFIKDSLYPLYTIHKNPHGSTGVNFEDGEFRAAILYLSFGVYLKDILHKNIEKYKYNKSDLDQFEKYCNRCTKDVANILENKYNWLTISLKNIEEIKDNIEKEIKSEGKEALYYMNADISIIIKEEFARKLLRLDKSEDERLNAIIKSISDKDKEKMFKTYSKCVEWLRTPTTLNGKSSIYFADIMYVCKLIGYNHNKLVSIVKNGKEFKFISYKDIYIEEYTKEEIHKILGDNIVIVNDLTSWGSGEYILFAKDKLWYVCAEHSNITDASKFPYTSNNFTKYAYSKDDVVKAILKPYDKEKGYNLIK